MLQLHKSESFTNPRLFLDSISAWLHHEVQTWAYNREHFCAFFEELFPMFDGQGITNAVLVMENISFHKGEQNTQFGLRAADTGCYTSHLTHHPSVPLRTCSRSGRNLCDAHDQRMSFGSLSWSNLKQAWWPLTIVVRSSGIQDDGLHDTLIESRNNRGFVKDSLLCNWSTFTYLVHN